jgi:mannosyltransferase
MMLAAVLRFHDLSRTSLWFDEAVSWRQASLPFLKLLAATAKDNYPPLHNIILHFLIGGFGDSEAVLRAPSALFGVLNVYISYRIGWALWDRRTGLTGALFLAIAGFHIWHSTDARMYTLLTLCASLYVWTAIELTRRRARWWLVANLLSAIALLYSHVFGSVIFFSLNAWALALSRLGRRQSQFPWRSWMGIQLTAGLLFLPWIIFLLQRFRTVSQGFWIPSATFRHVLSELAGLMGGPVPASVTCLLASFAIINAQNLRSPTGRWRTPDWRVLLLIVWFTSSIAFAYAVSMASFPIFLARYLIGGLPAMYLLAARGLWNLDKGKLTAQVALALTLTVLAVPAARYAFLQESVEDSRSAVRLLQQEAHPDDSFILDDSFELAAFQYYAPNERRLRSRVDMESLDGDPLKDRRYWALIRYGEDESRAPYLNVALKAFGVIGGDKFVDHTPNLETALSTHEISASYYVPGIRILLLIPRGSQAAAQSSTLIVSPR